MKRYVVASCLFFIFFLMGIAYINVPISCAGLLLQGNMLLGEKEWVKVNSLGRVIKARVDTGATTSSISAIEIQSVMKGDEQWVKFRFAHGGEKSEVIMFPVERIVRVKQSSNKGYDQRYVVKLEITIGNVTKMTDFTLRDRQHLIFPLLLGRSFLKQKAWVDVNQKFIQPYPSLTTLNEAL